MKKCSLENWGITAFASSLSMLTLLTNARILRHTNTHDPGIAKSDFMGTQRKILSPVVRPCTSVMKFLWRSSDIEMPRHVGAR